MDWDWLDDLPFYVMKGEGFVVNNYGLQACLIRYVEGNHVLTLSFDTVDETAERGRRFFLFRSYATHVEIPSNLVWDNGAPLTANESATVLERICRTFEKYKKRPCRVVVRDDLYKKREEIRAQLRARRRESSPDTR